MMTKAKGRRTATERERRRLRFRLLKNILRFDTVRMLSGDHKKLLFRFLSNVGSATDNMSSEASRIRTLEKAESDARRLRAALSSLDAKDADSLGSNYQHSIIPLSTRLLMLEELEYDTAALANVIKGEQKEIARLRRKRVAADLVETLCGFGISCRIRNDHDVDDRNVTTAMSCVMFSMIEADVEELSWGTTASIIKLSLRTLEEQSGKKFRRSLSQFVPADDTFAGNVVTWHSYRHADIRPLGQQA